MQNEIFLASCCELLRFINQLMRRRPLTVHGDGNNTRNFLYVEDVARAFDCILHKAEVGHVYNIGGTNEYRCASTVSAFSKECDFSQRQQQALVTFGMFTLGLLIPFTIDRFRCWLLGHSCFTLVIPKRTIHPRGDTYV